MKYLYINGLGLNKKNVYWKNYQSSLMACITHVLVQLKCISL